MRFSLFAIIVSITGCSTLSNTTNYDVIKDERFVRAYVYDWCEENQVSLGIFGTQCSGVYSPPIYSLIYSETNYVFYPMQISHNNFSIGPLLVPIIYTDYFSEQETMKYKVRSLNKGSNSLVKPIKVAFYVNNLQSSSCLLKEQDNDGISDIFTCDFTIDTDNISEFYSLLTLADQTEIKVEYTKNKFWSYRPIIAPAGKAGNTGKYIDIGD
jgi:hypothetical protein